MAGPVSVREVPEQDYQTWNALVAGSPDGSIYSSTDYLSVLCRVGGGRFRILGVFRGEELCGGIALYERDSAYGCYVAPRLLLYYMGPVLARYETKYPSQRTSREVEIMGALMEALAARRYGRVSLRCRSTLIEARPFLASGWTARPAYTYVVRLEDPSAVWDRMDQNLRRLVRRGEAAGLTFTDDDDFASFYRLHASTMERKEAARYLPEAAFREYFETLHSRQRCRLQQVRLPDGRAVATQLVLTWHHPVCHTVSAATDPEFSNLGASAFLRWRGFESLHTLGFAGTDLTDAQLNAVTRFKAQLGGDLAMTLILESPQTRRFRWGTGAERLAGRARLAAGRAVRRVLGTSRNR